MSNPEAAARTALSVDNHGVAHLRLTRPDKMNALDPSMIAALISAGEELAAMAGLRAVVISGEGRAFCAGLDLAAIIGGAGLSEDLVTRSHGNANRFQQLAMQFRKLPVPVIAAVHGICYGGGLQIAAGADLRVVAPDTRFAVMELKWGIVPDMGHFTLWRSLVRSDALRELTYTAREFSGTEAQAMGFATHTDTDPLGRAMAIAYEIANKNPDAIRAAKRLFAVSAEATEDTILRAESAEQARLLGTANQTEAVRSAMEGRGPKFED